MNQAPHLGGQAVQLVVAQVQIQQVCEVDEQLVWDGVDAVVAQIQDQHISAVLQVPRNLGQLIVAEVLYGRVRIILNDFYEQSLFLETEAFCCRSAPQEMFECDHL